MGRPKLESTGQQFGRLTVIEYSGTNKWGDILWKCKCSCEEGKEVIVLGYNIKNGTTTSCGCYKREVSSEKAKELFTTHGATVNGERTRLFSIWNNMISRTSNPNSYCGDKEVCEPWRKFENFELWALSTGYDDSLTIDRIDNEQGYSPENCRWATMKQQQRNRTNNLIVELFGMELCLSAWAEFTGVKVGTLFSRYYKGERGAKLFRYSRPYKKSARQQLTQ